MTDEIMLGSVGISVLLMIFLRLIYGTLDVPKKLKPWLAIVISMGLAITSLVIGEEPLTAKLIVQYLVQGFMAGTTAVGLNEITKKSPG